jgi:hypothetical protein
MTGKLKELEPNEIVRFYNAAKYFGYQPTQLRKKIESSEIPPPVPLSDDGRALGWFGWQIIEHQQKRLAAAQAAAEKKRVVR